MARPGLIRNWPAAGPALFFRSAGWRWKLDEVMSARLDAGHPADPCRPGNPGRTPPGSAAGAGWGCSPSPGGGLWWSSRSLRLIRARLSPPATVWRLPRPPGPAPPGCGAPDWGNDSSDWVDRVGEGRQRPGDPAGHASWGWPSGCDLAGTFVWGLLGLMGVDSCSRVWASGGESRLRAAGLFPAGGSAPGSRAWILMVADLGGPDDSGSRCWPTIQALVRSGFPSPPPTATSTRPGRRRRGLLRPATANRTGPLHLAIPGLATGSHHLRDRGD